VKGRGFQAAPHIVLKNWLGSRALLKIQRQEFFR
jgi:hypothetical protein